MEEILQSLPEPMQLNESLLVIAVMFLILLLILNSLVFKPMVGILEERQKRIDEGAQARSKSLQTVEESMAAYREALIDARRKALARRQHILKESEVGRNKIIGTAKEQAMADVQAAATQVGDQVQKAKASLREETEQIAQHIVASVLSRASS